jgi:hypothetical protein
MQIEALNCPLNECAYVGYPLRNGFRAFINPFFELKALPHVFASCKRKEGLK